MSTALVTGGAGFIGSHLVSGLLERGWTVRVFDNLSTGDPENLRELNVELKVEDIRDAAAVEAATEGVEYVFHLAAMISVPASMHDPAGCYQANVLGSLNVLQAARKSGVRRVVLSSSCAVYGDAPGEVDETSPTAPLSPYAASKLAMEQAALMASRSFGLDTISLRYFNVYGPRQSPDSPYAAAIPTFIQAFLEGLAPSILGDGKQTRDFVFVRDVVQANLLAAEAKQGGGSIFNIGSGRSVTILELVETLRRLFPGAPATTFGPPRAGDIRFSGGSIEAARRALGYRPATGLAEGLANTVEWARKK